MSALVAFKIAPRFVTERARLSPAEVLHGYRAGWIDDRAVVEIALDALKTGRPLSAEEEELALLLPGDETRVPEILDRIEAKHQPDAEAAAVWRFLALACLWEKRDSFPDPLEVVEMLFADFDYPSEMEPFVRLMPAPPGAEPGSHGIENRWQSYLSERAAFYRSRPSP